MRGAPLPIEPPIRLPSRPAAWASLGFPPLGFALLGLLAGCPRPAPTAARPLPKTTTALEGDSLRDPREIHLRRLRQLTFGGRTSEPRFSPDGQRLAFLKTETQAPADGGEPHERPRPHLLDLASRTELLPSKALVGAGHLWFGQDGSLCAGGRGAIQALAGGGGCRPPTWARPQSGGCAEAGGRWVCALEAKDGTSPSAAIWLLDPEAPPARPLPMGSGEASEPALDPGGRMIAWTSAEFGGPSALAGPLLSPGGAPAARIEVLPATGLGAPLAVSPAGESSAHPCWFPGGDRLAFSSNTDDAAGLDFDVFVVGADGEGLQRITFSPGLDVEPAVAPDGKAIAWVSERNAASPGERDLFVADWVE